MSQQYDRIAVVETDHPERLGKRYVTPLIDTHAERGYVIEEAYENDGFQIVFLKMGI